LHVDNGAKMEPCVYNRPRGGLAAGLGPVAAARALARPESDAVGSVTSGLACGDPPRRRSGLLVPSSSLELSDKMSCLLLAASGALFCPTSRGSSSRTTPAVATTHPSQVHSRSQVKSITPQVKSKLCSFFVGSRKTRNFASCLFRAGRRPSGPSCLFLPAPPFLMSETPL
jgi:hypothetical protein